VNKNRKSTLFNRLRYRRVPTSLHRRRYISDGTWRAEVLSDALASLSLGQLVENYDDPVHSAAERSIVADCPPS